MTAIGSPPRFEFLRAMYVGDAIAGHDRVWLAEGSARRVASSGAR